jgi:hypothetical protein
MSDPGTRELLACALTPFWIGFAFARTPCVRIYSLLDWFRVRENSLRTHLLPFGLVSRSRELLACAFTPFWTGFAFARTPCVRILLPFGLVSRSRELFACTFTPFCECFAFARTPCVRIYSFLDWFRVRENSLRTHLLPFGLVSRSRELLAYALTPFRIGFAFARTPCVRILLPFGLVSRSRELLAYALTPFWTGLAFARTPCVRTYSLLGWFRVRENSLRARLPHFVSASRSRELFACTFYSFWARFAFARTSCVHVYSHFVRIRVRENLFKTPFTFISTILTNWL